ncbi:HAD-IIB family hydrolase [Patescibacteria group bacterium]|nr:HAD-IIB family hydrolase [Patescibacteria group bacterium]
MKTYETMIFDLDGTLSVSKSPLSDEEAEVLSHASQQLVIAIITGGRFEQIKKQVIDRLKPDANLANLYILPTSGAMMYRYEDGSWTMAYQHPFNDEEKERVISALRRALADASFDIDPVILKGPQIEDRGSQITLSALGQQQDPEVKYAWDPDRKKRRELVSLLQDLDDQFDVKIGGTTSLDITKKGYDKAFGIREFFKVTGRDITKALFVGDELVPEGNDYAATTTGIDTRSTTGPEETARIIKEVLQAP